MSRSRSHRANRFGIMNHVGSIWTHETFENVVEANAFLAAARAEWKLKGWGDLARHRVVPVRVTVTPTAQPDHHGGG